MTALEWMLDNKTKAKEMLSKFGLTIDFGFYSPIIILNNKRYVVKNNVDLSKIEKAENVKDILALTDEVETLKDDELT